jgi:hypothetical protein
MNALAEIFGKAVQSLCPHQIREVLIGEQLTQRAGYEEQALLSEFSLPDQQSLPFHLLLVGSHETQRRHFRPLPGRSAASGAAQVHSALDDAPSSDELSAAQIAQLVGLCNAAWTALSSLPAPTIARAAFSGI